MQHCPPPPHTSVQQDLASSQGKYKHDNMFLTSSAYIDLPQFDEARLKELEDVVDLRETLHGFVKHSRVLLEKLDTLMGSNASLSDVAKAAHALKGAAKTVGATKLSACAEHIENEAKQGLKCSKYRQMLESSFEEMACHVSKRSQ